MYSKKDTVQAGMNVPVCTVFLFNKGRNVKMLVHKGTRTIETSRLILRESIMGDIEPMYRNWASDPEVTKFLTWSAHANLDVTENIISEWIKPNSMVHFPFCNLLIWRCFNSPFNLEITSFNGSTSIA